MHVDSCPGVKKTYATTRHADKLMLAAAWLLRVTGEANYGEAALAHWRAEGPSVYVGWDSLYAPAVNVLLQLSSRGTPVPGAEEYDNWWHQTFWPVWDKADGARKAERSG